MRGYKVFNPDWTCRGFQFEVGAVFTENVVPVCCVRGFHFCKKLIDCFNYYDFNPNNKVAEIEALGEIDGNEADSKCATNKIHIIRELTWYEVLNLVNVGKNCTGNRNTGDHNTGNGNTGHLNTGNKNAGRYNTGNRNTGSHNTGNWNTGDWNLGDQNTGDWNNGWGNAGNHNIGNFNTGDWNTASYSSGCFNTKNVKIMMFDKPSDWTMHDWLESEAREILRRVSTNITEWINFRYMTNEEKIAHPECETTGGYLKVINEKNRNQVWWDNLDYKEQDVIKALPNFDAKKFYLCTGIKVD